MKTLHDVVSCLSNYDPRALPVERAQAIVAQLVEPVEAIEVVAVRDALGRVLANDVVSPIDVPAHDNSAMDGYAVRGADLTQTDLTLDVIGKTLAGVQEQGPEVGPGQCIRVMTGAVMPDGCDTVVPQEFCTVDGQRVTIPASTRRGDNRRLRGEDLSRGGVALQAGRIVRPADLGLAASLGVAELAVRRRVRVAFFSTGDELRSIGSPLNRGQVYDSNRYTLRAMLSRLGIELVDMGIVRDDSQALESAFRSAAGCADAIITSGGVSVGEADYTKQIMASLGEVAFWTIAMRPGRPMAFGRVWSDAEHRGRSDAKSALVFGLPGNPVAVMVTFYFFVQDALLRMQGAEQIRHPLLQARSAENIRKKPGRTEYQRGVLSQGSDGRCEVRLTGQQGSGVLRSMSLANCFVVLDHARSDVRIGDAVDVLPFDGLI